jgi:DNA-binding transcriptional MerR regulator
MRVGEAASRAGVNVETFRYYERRGLLPEPERSHSGHRSYDAETVRFVRAIKEAQGLGFTLAEIEEYLRVTSRNARAASDEMRIRLAAKIDEVDTKIAALRRVRDGLAQVVGCACDSLDRCTCGAAYLARRGRVAAGVTTTLHVTNGESAANTLRATPLGGAVLAWDDVLHEGPVPAVTPAELRRVRARFLAEAGWGSATSIHAELARRDDVLAQAFADARPVVLWFEHDLYDQLQLLQVLSQREGRPQLIMVGAFEGHPDFHGLGELTGDELETLWPVRTDVTDELLAAASAAWGAVRAPDPLALQELAARESEGLPFLGPALGRLLEELPAAADGLSRSERQLLEALAEGARRPHELFLACQAREEAPFEGDAWAWRRIAALGSGEARLLAPAGGGATPAPPPRGDGRVFAATAFELTDCGRAVLAGDADRVELLGLDRWLGGTHLTPENDWRRDVVDGRVMRR